MAKLKWTNELDTGIEEIDRQHQKILQYINDLDEACKSSRKMDDLGAIVDELVEYTLSHFDFEEDMMEEAKYPALKKHKIAHELFKIQVSSLQSRLSHFEDVSEELHKLLYKWLISHIKGEDSLYVACVNANVKQNVFVEQKMSKGFFARLFA